MSAMLHIPPCGGEEAQKVHVNMKFIAVEQDRINPLVHAFQDYCMGRANIIMRFCFNTHNQATEPMKAYITALKDMVKDCDYGTLEDSGIA